MMKWRDNMLTTERVSQLQDMVIMDSDIDSSNLSAEEQDIVTDIQDRINTYAEEMVKKFLTRS